MSDNRTDEEFLDYVDAHCHSQDGALFSGEHLIRLRDLSGMVLDAMGGIDPNKLYPLRVVDAMPMVRRAREKLLATKAAQRMMNPRISSKDIVSPRNIELTDAIKEWRGLTEDREWLYQNLDEINDDKDSMVQVAVRLLKAAAR